MSRWFCVKESVEPAVSMLAFVAGGLVKANNPALIEPATPVAKGLLETIESGASREAVNALLKEVVSTLLEKVDKPEVQLAVKAALSKVSYNADSGDMPDIDLPLIRSLTTGFLEGLTA
ncbi:hypothetical protein [Syntrophus aciditrophicus]|uniref:Hypothetical cytosolic protein n=1 Tax=Syntrophus aciditrophicus (strain SB) TaxID=56780 RepID=Q2LQQ2_SYNAS|nr:hypothetical protein [Syntrophus aciditrophicus]ABC76416.1 hypothetical cytosolic protein [Syntrophus aciditrophicus SB]